MSARLVSNGQVREIRRLYATGRWSQMRLAAEYEVSQVTISRIILRVTYADVR